MMRPPDGSKMFFFVGKKIWKMESLRLDSVLSTSCCDMTLAWSSGVFDHCSLPKEMTWRCPAKIFASRDHGPLFARVVDGVVTAPVEFSILFACHGIVPRLLGERVGRWPFSLGSLVKYRVPG